MNSATTIGSALPANDNATGTAPAPSAMPTASQVWDRLHAAGLSRFRWVDGKGRTVLVRRVDPDFGFTVWVTSADDCAAVRGALESFGLPMAEKDVRGAHHFDVFPPSGPLALSSAAVGVVRWPGAGS